MLTFIVPTDNAPKMNDAYNLLHWAVRKIGNPNKVFIINSDSDKVLLFVSSDVVCNSIFNSQEIIRLDGEVVFIRSFNFNLIGDLKINSIFKNFRPKVGNRSRLIGRSVIGGNVIVYDEKYSVR